MEVQLPSLKLFGYFSATRIVPMLKPTTFFVLQANWTESDRA